LERLGGTMIGQLEWPTGCRIWDERHRPSWVCQNPLDDRWPFVPRPSSKPNTPNLALAAGQDQTPDATQPQQTATTTGWCVQHSVLREPHLAAPRNAAPRAVSANVDRRCNRASIRLAVDGCCRGVGGTAGHNRRRAR
jgi:hypothetical protein